MTGGFDGVLTTCTAPSLQSLVDIEFSVRGPHHLRHHLSLSLFAGSHCANVYSVAYQATVCDQIN